MGFFWGDLHGKLHVVKAVVVRVGEEDGQGEGFCLVHQDTHAAPETVWGVVEGAAFRGSRWDDGAGGHGVVATEAVGPGGAQGHIPRAVGELDLHAPKGHPSAAAGWPLPPAAMERDRGPPPASPSPRSRLVCGIVKM